MGTLAHGAARNDRDRHRKSGGDLWRLLAHASGDPTRAAATA